MDKIEVRSVGMYPMHWAIVDEANSDGVGQSATLRRIVREWKLQQDLLSLGYAYALNVITARQAIERLTNIVANIELENG